MGYSSDKLFDVWMEYGLVGGRMDHWIRGTMVW